MPAEPVPRPRRRFLRFSMRGLMVLVLVIGVGLSRIVHSERSARTQRDAVAAIYINGGSVVYDWEWRNGKVIPGGKPWAPAWFVDLIGVDFFGNVTAVWLPCSTILATNDPIVQIAGRKRLNWRRLNKSSVSDDGLAHLKVLTDLSVLSLGGAQVSDASLAHLKGLTKLSVLWLDRTPVSDAGLEHLKGLTKLSRLDLRYSKVTDAGMMELKQALPNLKIIR